MNPLTDTLAAEYRALLDAGVFALERIESAINRLEYVKSLQLAELGRLASAIADGEEHRDHGALAHRSVEAEIAVATRTGQQAVASRIGHAASLLNDYPGIAAAHEGGRLSHRHTVVIVEAGSIISDPAGRTAYETAVLPLAESMTAWQLRAEARLLAERYADRSLDERHEHARQARCVRVTELPDGMANLTAVLGAVEAYAIKDRIARIAHHARTNESTNESTNETTSETTNLASTEAGTRTLAQTQADVFAELLLTGLPEGFSRATVDPFDRSAVNAPDGDPFRSISGRVQVTVPALALANAGHPDAAPYTGPADLAGYGPIPVTVARRLLGNNSSWERVLTHPVSGAVVAVDRYRPSTDLIRLLAARDQHCRFPGCVRRIDHCDIDHTIPASKGGPTSPQNAGHLCRKHHMLKHYEFLHGCAWRPKQRPGGIYEWSSPTGRRYVETPVSAVRFAPVPAPGAPPPQPPPPTGPPAPKPPPPGLPPRSPSESLPPGSPPGSPAGSPPRFQPPSESPPEPPPPQTESPQPGSSPPETPPHDPPRF